jgi:hypothetical protein
VSAESVAATAMTPASAAGQEVGLPEVRELPAAATTVTPLLRAYEMALVTAATCEEEPNDMLMTLAPWSAAQTIPVAASDM